MSGANGLGVQRGAQAAGGGVATAVVACAGGGGAGSGDCATVWGEC